MSSRPDSLLSPWRGGGVALVLALCAAAAPAPRICVPQEPGPDIVEPTPRAEPLAEPKVELRFEGFLPGSIAPELEGTFEVDFAIYRSPQGGEAIWRETQQVTVEKGRMDVRLGAQKRIPMEIHEATFKFLGASVDGAREVYPRFAIVNVVYVSPKEALVARTEKRAAGDSAGRDAQYARRRSIVADGTEKPCTWRAALQRARKAGGDLPDYEDWYLSLRTAPEDAVLARAGHYEWVLPWVYDTSSHGRYNLYFRGRFQGCDYMDLSPAKDYPYRIARPAPQPARTDSQEDGD